MVAPQKPGSAAVGDITPEDLQALLSQATDILHQLDAIHDACGAHLERLAAVDWAALAAQNRLAGVPRFLIERTITDAHNVLTTGRQDLRQALQAAQEPAAPFLERLQALVRLYADAPGDMRNRQQRLSDWLARIDRAWQESGEPPLSQQLAAS